MNPRFESGDMVHHRSQGAGIVVGPPKSANNFDYISVNFGILDTIKSSRMFIVNAVQCTLLHHKGCELYHEYLTGDCPSCIVGPAVYERLTKNG